VKLKPVKLAPALIAICVITFICVVRRLEPELPDRLEHITYDWRVRMARHFPAKTATNLGFVFIRDESITAINDNSLGFRYGLYWPRQIYGRVYRELTIQDAKAAAFDVLFPQPRPDHGSVPVSATNADVNQFFSALHPGEKPTIADDLLYLDSDDYFAWQIKRGGTAILAAEHSILPFDLFATNALAVADITADRDADGVLRRARAFTDYFNWHKAFKQAEAEGYLRLDRFRVERDRIVFPRSDGEEIAVPIDSQMNFDLTDFDANLPPGSPRKARAFTTERVWHMGIVLAAQELKLDLSKAEIDSVGERIILRGANGIERIIPVDAHNYFYINWELTSADQQLTKEAFESLLKQDLIRHGFAKGTLTNRWAGKLAVIGSIATGNDLTDRGATPLEKDTPLVSKHWNVANSIITGRFIQRSPLVLDLFLIAILGVVAAWLTWQLRALVALLSVLALMAGYIGICCLAYIQQRFWLPMFLPTSGALLMTHVCVVTWRVIFEQADKRRVKNIFSKVVSPKIMNELLGAEKLSLGGARREVTVLFADVRGFTEFTDKNQEHAEAYAAEHKLTGEEKETYFDTQARETLRTVNLYLGLIADTIVKYDATLDKFIGDCVMAFWGAPTPNRMHATACVRAAIEAQRAMYQLNKQRAEQNKKIEQENIGRAASGLPPKPLFPILLLGSGINTGVVTVGLMGSETQAGVHQGNYTIFGREVNLASRLESVSGRGRIVISEATYSHLQRDDPALAATCIPLPDATVKGIRSAVKVYEVPWRPPGSPSLDEEFFSRKPSDTNHVSLQAEKP
jgi:class 3 adenylate cyclase/CHASE2 domain-containing sensor protein